MVSVCFYFQVHQPYRLRKYSIFEINENHDYFDKVKNEEVFHKVAKKCYLPTNQLLLDQLNHVPEFKISYSLSGVFLDQAKKFDPSVIDSFRKLVDTGRTEILDETYYHSLSFLYSKKEFIEQVKMHRELVWDLFAYKPKVFRNTELIYSNEVAYYAEKMGYKGILAEGVDHVLGWRSPNFVYRPRTAESIALLLKNYKLSDDIAFRFSNKNWTEWPLTADKFAHWVNNVNGSGNTVNLFMDYETFGEHQWEDTGIFDFMRAMPRKILEHPDNDFKTPSEVIDCYEPMDTLDIHNIISWADLERDLSAWLGNKMQHESIHELYAIEEAVKKTNDKNIIEDWRKLTTSDHFYYMCTKYFSDGDVHKYFNPYDSPYDAFIAFMNAMTDLVQRVKKVSGKLDPKEVKILGK
ncbi:alpha-amylase [Candidatus Woesearchaeota archaeon CG11_big_fil_rev_8_21_14_0_20_43_8]|nr:MAG: alpha-amylase [Candidatus Woesearchaeota archaeon CG11_big_fil_rev_8_21_14_0_20_43_8]PIO05162.1 MAG: alpha-amylase [Candidatus Woesearchaeota archaeon CG08_land_8_20_14_0_20_43_7]